MLASAMGVEVGAGVGLAIVLASDWMKVVILVC